MASFFKNNYRFIRSVISSKLLTSVLVLCLLFLVPVVFLSNSFNVLKTKSTLKENPIVWENKLPGTTTWQSDELAEFAKSPRLGEDEEEEGGASFGTDKGLTRLPAAGDQVLRGYADQQSVNIGQTIKFYISDSSTTASPQYNIDIYRMGWYGGAGSTLKKTISGLIGQNQPLPTPDPSTGLIEANWQPSYTLTIPDDGSWTSGVYLAKLTENSGDVGYIIFVVRNDAQIADIVYQVPFNTYQAYNGWGGKSLYDYNSPGGRAYKVSFNRPYDVWQGAGLFLDGEYNFVRYLESQGYNVTYVANSDTLTNTNLMRDRKVFLSPWHDEYWSAQMRYNLMAARDYQGKNLAFFGADAIYWQVRFENSPLTGAANRVMTCYKDALVDPFNQASNYNPTLTTILWRDVGQPENAELGGMYDDFYIGDFGNTGYPWVVTNANHWVYAGTGLNNGDTIPEIVGYEADSMINNGFAPETLVMLSNSPNSGGSKYHNATIYNVGPNGSGPFVFNAGTVYWAWKLDNTEYQSHGIDTRVQKMTNNILNGMINATTSAPSSAYNQTILNENPIASWRLGDINTTVAANQITASPHGNYSGNPILGVPGAIVGDSTTSVQFNGLNQYVDVPYDASLNPSVFSVETWAMSIAYDNTHAGVVNSRTWPFGWVIYQTPSPDNRWSFWINNGSGMTALNGQAVRPNKWAHLVGTFDGTTARFYINGVLVNSAAVSFTPNNANSLTIGQGEQGGNFFFLGRISNVSLYNKALTLTQIENHYNAGITAIYNNPNPSPSATLLPTSIPTPTPTPTPTPIPTPVADSTPPTVSITSPSNGAIVSRNSILNINANATDNIGVVKVEFYVNGALKCTDTTSTYSCAYKVPAARGKVYTIVAKAYDVAGNNSSSSINVTSQ